MMAADLVLVDAVLQETFLMMRRTLVLRFLRHHSPAGPDWIERFGELNRALSSWAGNLSPNEVLRWHQMLDYAKWQDGDDDRRRR